MKVCIFNLNILVKIHLWTKIRKFNKKESIQVKTQKYELQRSV